MKFKFDIKAIARLTLAKGRNEDFAWDTDLEGFGYRLRQGGRHTYVVQYRASGRTRRITIGPAVKLTLPQARETARKLLARVALGHDPQAEKEGNRRQAVLTVRSVAATYLETKRAALRPSTFRQYERYLTGPHFKALHPLAITAVTRADVAACIRAIGRNHSDCVAGLARRTLSTFFAWAIADGLLGSGTNPVDGSHRPDPLPSRDRVLTDAELAAIWNACADNQFGRVIRLLILLGSRRGEVGGMCWSELDLEAGTWTLPAARAKNKHSHTVALPPSALAIINSMPRTDRDQIFGNHAGIGFTNWGLPRAYLQNRLGGAVKPWRIHDLRRTVATRMADIGIEPHHIEACLNHFSGHRSGIAGVYNRSNYERAIKNALLRWNEHVLALAEGRVDKVVPLRAS